MDIVIDKNPKLKEYDSVLVQSIYKSFMSGMRSEYACNSFHDLSAVGTSKLCEVDFGGNKYVNLKNGFIKLIDCLASTIPVTAINLNEKVTNINWIGDLSKVQTQSVIYGDTLNYKAKYVVSSIPLGVLKSNYYSLFSPPLPTNKINAMQRLSFGTVNKFFLIFDKPYWPEIAAVYFLWPEGFPNSEFNKQFTQFVIDPKRPNVLVTLITGKESISSESMSDESLLDILTGLFRQFYPQLNIQRPKLVR